MITGVVLLALGLKKVPESVGDAEHHDLADPLTGIGLYALYFGVALYLLAHVAFKLRATHILNLQRLVVAVALVALLPLATQLPALAVLMVLTAVIVGLVGFETVRFARIGSGSGTKVRRAAQPAPESVSRRSFTLPPGRRIGVIP